MSENPSSPAVTIWFDPVCPFSWNTARWLKAVADKTGMSVEWRLMSLAVLNEGREMPPKQQSRMHDSRRVGRLMTAIRDQYGNAGLAAAYFAFAERYFDRSNRLTTDSSSRCWIPSNPGMSPWMSCRTRRGTNSSGAAIRLGRTLWAKPAAARSCVSTATRSSVRC